MVPRWWYPESGIQVVLPKWRYPGSGIQVMQLQTMSKSGNFGEERAKVLGKFMFLMDSNEQPSQLKISVNNPVLPTQERSLETIRMLASGPTKIKQPLYRTHDMMDEEEEQGAVMPMAEFSQLPPSDVSNESRDAAGQSPHHQDMRKAKEIKMQV
uniref:Uncharacterized protein n=1 Tax=Ditylenchus dipsaci TaxID=166011 RepID=A0A915DFQ8_9BILA